MANLEKIMQNEAFKKMGEERASAFIELSKRLDGKSGAESIPVIIDFFRNLPPGNELSPQEQAEAISAAMSGMSQKERERFEGLMKVYGMLNRR